MTAALPSELLQKVKRIQIRSRRLVTDLLAGEYESAFRGRGMEFEEVREYQPGDDIRHIEWNVTARTGTPHVKVHREERELTVMLLVDVSASGGFGSGARLKRDVAAELAAVLAWTAIRSNDRVGLIAFTDRIERHIPPKKGRGHVWRVIREILGLRPAGRGTDIETALELLGRVAPRRVVGFVLSDFLDRGWEERLRVAARRHDLTAVTVADRREESLPPLGLITLEDAESGELLTVDTRRRAVVEGLAAEARREREERAGLFRSAGVGQLDVWTDEPYVDSLIRYFRAREARR